MLQFSDYDAFGFDLDNTLAKYNVYELFNLVNKSLSEFLVNKKGYGVSLLKPVDPDFCARGIIYDIPLGNFLKLSENGTIIHSSHGTKQMSEDDIIEEYGITKHWPPYEKLSSTFKNSENFRIFDNFFDMSDMMVCARIVDQLDKKNGGKKLAKYDFWKDMSAAAYYTYNNHDNFADNSGGFFPVWKENKSRFVEKCHANVKAWLKKLKDEGKKVFILTSSFNDFAVASLQHILGDDWKHYVHMVLTNARKPDFFEENNPHLLVEDCLERGPVEELYEDGIFSQGNYKTFMKYLQQTTAKTEPKVLFFGDSLKSDIYPAKKYAGWDTVFLLEELPFEPIYSQHGPDAINIASKSLGREKEYFTSKRWGSFFPSVAPDHSILSKSNCTNTFCSSIVQNYADLVIPHLEYICDLPMDHVFEATDYGDESKCRFYPPTFSDTVQIQ